MGAGAPVAKASGVGGRSLERCRGGATEVSGRTTSRLAARSPAAAPEPRSSSPHACGGGVGGRARAPSSASRSGVAATGSGGAGANPSSAATPKGSEPSSAAKASRTGGGARAAVPAGANGSLSAPAPAVSGSAPRGMGANGSSGKARRGGAGRAASRSSAGDDARERGSGGGVSEGGRTTKTAWQQLQRTRAPLGPHLSVDTRNRVWQEEQVTIMTLARAGVLDRTTI